MMRMVNLPSLEAFDGLSTTLWNIRQPSLDQTWQDYFAAGSQPSSLQKYGYRAAGSRLRPWGGIYERRKTTGTRDGRSRAGAESLFPGILRPLVRGTREAFRETALRGGAGPRAADPAHGAHFRHRRHPRRGPRGLSDKPINFEISSHFPRCPL